MKLLLTLALLTTALAQGIPGTGRKPCCACSPTRGAVVCRDVPDDQHCITNPVKCVFDEAEEQYCCCCSPADSAIVCTAKPKGESCLCPAVQCNIPWEPEWAETWIPEL